MWNARLRSIFTFNLLFLKYYFKLFFNHFLTMKLLGRWTMDTNVYIVFKADVDNEEKHL